MPVSRCEDAQFEHESVQLHSFNDRCARVARYRECEGYLTSPRSRLTCIGSLRWLSSATAVLCRRRQCKQQDGPTGRRNNHGAGEMKPSAQRPQVFTKPYISDLVPPRFYPTHHATDHRPRQIPSLQLSQRSRPATSPNRTPNPNTNLKRKV